jgi:hypothetical protein
VVLADQQEGDGSLTVIPGFHHVAKRYFELVAAGAGGHGGAVAAVPKGGFFPFQEDVHSDLMATTKARELQAPSSVRGAGDNGEDHASGEEAQAQAQEQESDDDALWQRVLRIPAGWEATEAASASSEGLGQCRSRSGVAKRLRQLGGELRGLGGSVGQVSPPPLLLPAYLSIGRLRFPPVQTIFHGQNRSSD